ncbi:MAG: ABC transporter ATP-binding protein [Thaumarchaeota archaeon]|nr:ABC transporter ATP-binding protein [Nitrososphaerota archaeon]
MTRSTSESPGSRSAPRQTAQAVLEIRDLKISFRTYLGEVKAVDGLNLSVSRGEIIGLVGESGCGKSVTALAIAGLLPRNADVLSGEILIDGKDLRKMSKADLRRTRLEDLAMVFQDPMTYLNPVLTVGSQITEIMLENPALNDSASITARLDEISKIEAERGKTEELGLERQILMSAGGGKLGKRDAKRLARLRTLAVLRMVRLPYPERIFKMFPHELSGGMRQRAMIAMALVRKPKLILADEITTALDVTVQAQVLALLNQLKDEIDSSIVLITHDLGVVAKVCNRVAVMYAGNIVEVAEVKALFRKPLHPYTVGLLAAIPRADVAKSELTSIPGSVPDLIAPPSGCRYHPRCPHAFAKCSDVKPILTEVEPNHWVACFLFDK